MRELSRQEIDVVSGGCGCLLPFGLAIGAGIGAAVGSVVGGAIGALYASNTVAIGNAVSELGTLVGANPLVCFGESISDSDPNGLVDSLVGAAAGAVLGTVVGATIGGVVGAVC